MNPTVIFIVDDVEGMVLPILVILSFSVESVTMVSAKILFPSTAKVYLKLHPFGRLSPDI